MSSAGFIFGSVGTPRSTPKKPGGSVGTLMHLAEQGLLAFEIGWVRAVRVSEKTCTEIREKSLELGCGVSVHAPYYINLNADEQEWPKSRKRLMDAAHYGHLAGATDIVFHPGSYFGQPAEEVWKLALPRLRDCMKELRQAGNPVCLRPETMGKSAMLGSLQDTLILAQEIKGVKPCLDFAHLHARSGDGTVNSYSEWCSILEQYTQALGPHSLKELHCHLSGIEYGPKGERNHLMLKDSDLNLEALLQALHDFNCAGRILCESPEDMDLDALFIKDVWDRTRA